MRSCASAYLLICVGLICYVSPLEAKADFYNHSSYFDWPKQCSIQTIDPNYRVAVATDKLQQLESGDKLSEGLADQIYRDLVALEAMDSPKALHLSRSSRTEANLVIDIGYFGVGDPRPINDNHYKTDSTRLTTIKKTMAFGNDMDNVMLFQNDDDTVNQDIAKQSAPGDCIHAFVTGNDYVQCSLENLINDHGDRKLAVIHVGFPDMLSTGDRNNPNALRIIADFAYLRTSVTTCVRQAFLRGSGESTWYKPPGISKVIAP